MRSPIDPSGQFALDANALGSLKQQAKTAPREALGKVASQFEAVFVQMLLKQMREALPQDGPLSSDTMKSYTAMFDQQVAQQLASRGIGLKKMIEKQLAVQLDGAKAGADPAAPGTTSAPPASAPATPPAAPPTGGASAADNASVSLSSAVAKAAAIVRSASAATSGRIARASSATGAMAPAATSTASSTGVVPAAIQSFVDKLRPQAEAVAKAMGVPAEYLLAQAGLETGWGRSLARAANGTTSYNLFGVKAGSSWNGAVAQAKTTEYANGEAVQTNARFRSYGSFTEAFQDFAQLLRNSPRYSGVLANARNPDAYAAGMQRAGYATDPNYGAKLARAIHAVTRCAGPPQMTASAAGAPGVQPAQVQADAASVDNNVVAG